MRKLILKNKVAVITGGASGIGEAGTRRFADEGAVVIMLDVNEKAGISLESELTQKGQKVWFIKTDISDESSVKNAFEKIASKYEEIDILYNNASIFLGGRDLSVSEVETEMVKESNLNDPSFDNEFFLKQITPLRRWGKPSDVASLACFLASDDASYLNGVIIPCDGGITMNGNVNKEK